MKITVRTSLSLPSLCAAAFAMSSCGGDAGTSVPPNVVFILADDLGYGDLSCLGQTRFHTPNIDSLAARGMIFTQHYAGTAVSAPSRSCLVTGQHTGHTPIRGNKEYPVEGQYPIPGDTYNIFRMFASRGYSTGVFGKWGLGAPGTEGAPEAQGVDEFFGYNCQRLAHNYYPGHLWHNSTKIVLEGNSGHGEGDYAPYLIHEKALEFIRGHRDKPFFLWYTTTIPHAELKLPEAEMAALEGSLSMQPEKSYKGCDDGPEYKVGGYGSQQNAHAAFASMVTLLDRQVGEICSLIDSLGLSGNTMIVFTSDNGPHLEGGADPDFFDSNGPFRGYKRDLYEGGIRVPFIVKWPGKVQAGSSCSHVSAFWDFLPTAAEITGAEIPQDVKIDGISYLPSLVGSGRQEEHGYMYWEFHESGGRQALRKGDWKAVRYNVSGGGPLQLYDLSSDIGETHDVAAGHPDLVQELDSLMSAARTPSALFNFSD